MAEVRSAATPSASSFRPEIQALRAAAVLGVVLNHLWPERLTGGYVGVDVFFVISGFLITSHLLREVDRTGRIGLAGFWARRARRLLPASLLVLLVSAALSYLFIPISQLQVALRQIIASALYVQNWLLASDAVDYFASANSASPVTHYWSLSAEEQFYVVWPLLVLLAVGITRGRWRAHRRTAIVAVLGLVTVASLAFSVVYTSVSPSAAYFITPTRAWEFGIGGLVAALAIAAPRRATLAILLSWAGWAAIAASVVLFTATTPFPGWLALLPVLGTAAVIVAGPSDHAWSPGRLTTFGPVQLLGDVSYSLYLWHWPLIIIAPFILGYDLSARHKIVILALSIALAWLSKRFVEDPARTAAFLARARPRRTLVASLAAMIVVVGVSAWPLPGLQARTDAARASLYELSADPAECYGAGAVAPGTSCAPDRVLENPDQVLVNASNQGNPVERGSTCQQDRDVAEIHTCEFGAPAEGASLNVVMTGDSHIGHWTGAIERLAVQNDWHVTMMLKSSCAVNLDPSIAAGFYLHGAASCHEWAAAVTDRIAQDDSIDLVLTSSISRQFIRTAPDGSYLDSATAAGYAEAWQQWLDAGKRVAVLADVPTMTVGEIPNCVARHLTETDPCTVPADVGLTTDPMVVASASIDDPAFALVDLTSFFCSGGLCHTIAGGVLMYGDANHISNTYSRTLAPFLLDELRPLLPG